AKQQKYFVSLFDSKKEELDLLKFVPASGAATRMFKFLHQFLDNYDLSDDIEAYLQKEENANLKKFFDSIGNFAFTDLVKRNFENKYPDYKNFEKGKQYFLFVKEMLEESGLNFNNTPKGLVPFHKY